MTPQEKAKELVEKYKPYVYPYVGSSFLTNTEIPEQILRYAKKCSLFAVEELIELSKYTASSNIIDFWAKSKKKSNY